MKFQVECVEQRDTHQYSHFLFKNIAHDRLSCHDYCMTSAGSFDDIPFGDEMGTDGGSFDPLDSQSDPFRPPDIPTEVHCIHCNQEYESYLIQWRVETDADGKAIGFWCCPIPNCDGQGFGFDIFPTDPDYLDSDGEKMWCDDED